MKTLDPKEIIETQQSIRTLERCFNEADLESIKLQVENSVKLLEGKINEIVPISLTLEDGSFKAVFDSVIDDDDGKEYVTFSNFILDGGRKFVPKSDHEMFYYEEKFIESYLNLLTYPQ